MASSKIDGKVAPQFAPDPWCLIEEGFDAATLSVSETLFSQANGYLGTRGTFEEPAVAGVETVEGTYLNGVFVRTPIHYDESAYGFASHNNKMIMVPDAKRMRVSFDGQAVQQGEAEVLAQTRSLDMRSGLLSRSSRWRMAGGKEISIETRRFVSAARPNVMVLEYKITADQHIGAITLETGLDAAGEKIAEGTDPRAGALSLADCYDETASYTEGGVIALSQKVSGREHMVVSACVVDIEGAGACEPTCAHGFWGVRYSGELKPGEQVFVKKYVYYGDAPETEAAQLLKTAKAELEAVKKLGFDKLLQEQERVFSRFWKTADMEIAGVPAVQQGMRFNLFQLFQSAGRDGKRALGAKGLSGSGYDGHYFWDTEIYAVPFFVFTQPEIAKDLIRYRINALDAARKRAREMGHESGALYPWRTIGGEECSSFFPAGSAQYHINAAIAYALTQYVDATGDEGLLLEGGAEMLFETARLWMSLGHFSKRHGGAFSIHEVTGPDEYSAMVDNNLYTNAMAKHHLSSAVRFGKELKKKHAATMKALMAALSLTDNEIEMWEKAAAAMYLPYDETLAVYEQCEGFLSKPEWDFAGTPGEQYPLLLNFHPLKIYRHQVLKQADVVLAQVLLPDQFGADEKSRNLAYYEPRTTHDSTLSACIYSIANSESGDQARAYEMFEETYRMDLENRHSNTHYGLHMACMAGSWMAVVYGFAGMRFAGGQLSFDPYVPKGWGAYAFSLQVQGGTLKIEVAADGVKYALEGDESLWVMHRGNAHQVGAQKQVTLA